MNLPLHLSTNRVDLHEFQQQRRLLAKIADLAQHRRHYVATAREERLLEGLLNLTDALYDWAVERKGEPFAVPRIVLNVSGGVVQEVFCSDPHAQVVLIDWDADNADPKNEHVITVEWEDYKPLVAYVVEFPTDPLSVLWGTPVEAVLEAAKIDVGLCECEAPGRFCSGVPGILARVRKNGKLAAGAKVERCDLCRRYPSDTAAFQALQDLGLTE
ncbi:MAG: hypothetical protein JXB10_10335 [Pirellulales bacterium]|nr:hypothetical protein [Pirellulales bacterium]